MSYAAFYNIYSESLHKLLGVDDIRSVRSKIENIGVKVYGSGKDAYIITEEFLQALRKNKKSGYISKDKENAIFYK